MSTMTLTPMTPGLSTGTLRLTRRGRLVVLALGVLLAVLVGVVLATGSVATSEKGTPPPTEVITVSGGDTLWAIAAERADDGDVRATIEHIQQLNSLDGGLVVAGQRLRVPAS